MRNTNANTVVIKDGNFNQVLFSSGANVDRTSVRKMKKRKNALMRTSAENALIVREQKYVSIVVALVDVMKNAMLTLSSNVIVSHGEGDSVAKMISIVISVEYVFIGKVMKKEQLIVVVIIIKNLYKV